MKELKAGTKIKFKNKNSILGYYETYIKVSNIDKYIFEIKSCISHGPGNIKTYCIVNNEVNSITNRNYIFGEDKDFIVLKEELS